MKKRHPHKQNILLVNITRLGDMLQATPTIAGLKRENPGCRITVLVEKQFAEVCHFIPNIDEVVALDLAMTVRSLAREQDGIVDAYEYLTEIVDDLRSRNFDYCLNMSSSAYTAILLRLIGIGRSGGWTADDEGYRVIESSWAQLFATSVFHQNRQYNSLNLVDVFRCSADVDDHPYSLLIDIQPDAKAFAEKMIADANFQNQGPLVAIQAGASQQKRQWLPEKFVRLINILTNRHNARVVLCGTKKELEIINPIYAACDQRNVMVAAGNTSIPQLAALLKLSDILITGDTGPMHVSVAVGTPVVSMFLASAFGFETGPYSEGNLVLQPVIGCGPCNPNKSCSRPDCHDQISPELIAELTAMRLKEDFKSIPEGMIDPNKVILYRSFFDEFGFCDLQALNKPSKDRYNEMRQAYRKLWLDELGGMAVKIEQSRARLKVTDNELSGLEEIAQKADQGSKLLKQLERVVSDMSIPASELGRINGELNELDRDIESLGFNHPHLGPLSRMFCFAKENLSGTEALELASQMGGVYVDLKRRCEKLAQYYTSIQ